MSRFKPAVRFSRSRNLRRQAAQRRLKHIRKLTRTTRVQLSTRSRRRLAGQRGVTRVLNPLTLQSYSILSGRVWVVKPRRSARNASTA